MKMSYRRVANTRFSTPNVLKVVKEAALPETQLLAASLLPLKQGILHKIVYSWLVIGLIGGWTASLTQSL
jgi:hypothetical protein